MRAGSIFVLITSFCEDFLAEVHVKTKKYCALTRKNIRGKEAKIQELIGPGNPETAVVEPVC